MMKDGFARYEAIFLALADRTRLELLGLMNAEPASVGYLVESIGESQPKVSRHLAYLRKMGIVSTHREGKRIYYAIRDHGDREINIILNAVIASAARLLESQNVDRPQRDQALDEHRYPEYWGPASREVDRENWDERNPDSPERNNELEVFLL